MRYAHYISAGFGSCICCFSTAIVAFAQDNTTRPNVIYVFPDQMRNSAMGFWTSTAFRDSVNFRGDPVITPNIDSFACEARVLTSAMSNYPLSSPHRGMLLTGMYPENSGIALNCNSNRPLSTLREDAVCISDVFQEAGYDCAYIGKLHADYPTPNDPQRPGHYVEDSSPVWDVYTPKARRHGFNYWYSYGTYDVHKHPHYWDTDGQRHDVDEWSPYHEADKAIAYLRNEHNERDTNRPFFLMVAFNPPHSPYSSTSDCPEEMLALYQDKSIDSLLVRPNADLIMDKAKCAPYYFASISGIDKAFGKILQALDSCGLRDNTIVVFSSDHGETMCSHGIEDPKNSPYAESMNVPFLLRYPQKVMPKVDRGLLLSTPDVMPTLLGMCGLKDKTPSSVEGRDFSWRFFDNKKENNMREGALYIRNTDGEKDAQGKVISYFPVARGIKTLRYTMAITIDKKTKGIKDVLLFDDVKDPYQQHNIPFKDNKKLFHELCRQMVPLLKEANDPWYKQRILNSCIPYDDNINN